MLLIFHAQHLLLFIPKLSERNSKAGSLGFAEALLTFYNKKTRFGLEWSKLYKKKSPAANLEEAEPESLSGNETHYIINPDIKDMEETKNADNPPIPRQMNLFSLAEV